ncbi:MAG: M24 family metallopeptidase [Burkholderiales bacterium]|nr:M24 family metallopeptidase [Anaerolineae bacterium]
MNRLEEINAKHEQIRALLNAHKADALWLRRINNIAWITAGADASIAVNTDMGAYSVLVTVDKLIVYTSNIEHTRLYAEEGLEELGFEYHASHWYAGDQPDTGTIITDDGAVEDDIQRLRMILSESEQQRLRTLGRDATAALEESARAVRPGDTEFDIAARTDACCRALGGVAVVNLIGTDERISQFRHPLPTFKRLEKYAMLVVCMRREGLIVSATRLAHIGDIPDSLSEKLRRVSTVDATTMVATKPGRTLGDIFFDLQDAYAEQNESDQWAYHHQGGPAGYKPRERIVTPGDPTVVHTGQAFAWNPSIVGCKAEDTILVGESGFEIVTDASDQWPALNINVDGQSVRRPSILQL